MAIFRILSRLSFRKPEKLSSGNLFVFATKTETPALGQVFDFGHYLNGLS
jgi:hypothetical protein